jgi:hypothetical protein
MIGAIATLLLSTTVAFDVEVTVGFAHASTCVTSLTSVTMDVCVAKQRFPFGDPDLLGLTSHLGGGRSILRIGGSDQNSFYYNMDSNQSDPFSAATGDKCCTHSGSCRSCADDCTMPAPYWKSIITFAEASGHKFLFGLTPDVKQASSLISHSARTKLPVFAYSFGNEDASSAVVDGYPVLRKLLDSSLFPVGKAPLLAGPDLYVQRFYNYTLDEALAGKDSTIAKHLAEMRDFGNASGHTLDAWSWHTYDYETPMIGMTDHQDLLLNPLMACQYPPLPLAFSPQ